MTHPIHVVLFDFGGVIAPPGHPDTVLEVEGELGIEAGSLQRLMYECDPWRDLSVGRVSEDAYWQAIGDRLSHAPCELRRRLLPLWESSAVDEEVIALVRAIRARVRVALLSNATLGLEERLEALGVADLFEPVINSARVGLRKPDPLIFLHAITVLETPPQAILFVDDKARNTVVAESLGIPSIVFSGPRDLASALAGYGILAPSETEL